MFKLLTLVRGKAPRHDRDDDAETMAFVDRRGEARHPVFREAVLTLEGYYRIRAVITDVSTHGARVAFSTRTDLPSRIVIAAPTLKLDGWARVVWQRDGEAGLAFLDAARKFSAP